MSGPEDVRTTDPDQSARRRRAFRDGWDHAVNGRQYVEDTLSRLTWQNLGWRLGSVVGATSEVLVDEMYEWCVRQQAAGGVVLADD